MWDESRIHLDLIKSITASANWGIKIVNQSIKKYVSNCDKSVTFFIKSVHSKMYEMKYKYSDVSVVNDP